MKVQNVCKNETQLELLLLQNCLYRRARVRACVRVRVCVCVCERERERESVCVCVCFLCSF